MPPFLLHVHDGSMPAVASELEALGRLDNDAAVLRHLQPTWNGSVYATTRRVLELARSAGVAPSEAAGLLADALAQEAHPLYPQRARAIVASLHASKWHAASTGPS